MYKFFFKKKSRLCSSKQFFKVYRKHKKIERNDFILLARFNNFFFPRLGISLSKRNIKYSHDRNRIKRLIKESFRLLQHNLLCMDFIIIVKKRAIFLKNHNIQYILKILWGFFIK